MAAKSRAKKRLAPPPAQPIPSGQKTGASGWSLAAALLRPVDITFLVYFRIAFGLLMLWLGWQYFHGQTVDGQPYNLLKYHYVDPQFHFTYYGFDWVRPWPDYGRGQAWLDFDWIEPERGNGVLLHAKLLGLCAALIVVGLFYRFAAAGFCLGFTQFFLIDQANYLNHYYLICLLSLLLTFLPAHRKFSLDALMLRRLRSNTAPAWTLWLLRLQFAVVYFYAGVAKCTADWMRGEPIRTMLAYKQEGFPNIGHLFTEEWFVRLVTYSGLAFDLLIVPLMLWRKTRWLALGGMIVFHLTNTQLFHIDIFPWLMISATLILFYPDLLPFGLSKHRHGYLDGSIIEIGDKPSVGNAKVGGLTRQQKLVVGAVISYAMVQLVMPLRPFFYPGVTNWTDEGKNFSWRMLSRDLQPTEPPRFLTRFRLNGRTMRDEIPFEDPSIWWKHWQYNTMLKNPDQLLQFVHWQADTMRRQGARDVEIRVVLKLSLNGRKPQDFVDPKFNLANEPRRLITPYPWVVPLAVAFDERRSDPAAAADRAAPPTAE